MTPTQHARQILQMGRPGLGLLGTLQTREPNQRILSVDIRQAGIQGQNNFHPLLVGPLGVLRLKRRPQVLQPSPAHLGGTPQLQPTQNGLSSHLGHQTLRSRQALPSALQSFCVVGVRDQLQNQAGQQALGCSGRKGLVLGQQCRGFQRFGGLTGQTRGLEL